MTRPRWRLLVDPEADAALQMARDEALLRHPGPPTLRLYAWRPCCLSLGYFQDAREPRLAAFPCPRRVRRITGGGAIHHGGDLTFTISADRSTFPYDRDLEASYRLVHEVVTRALACLGIEAALAAPSGEDREPIASPLCFEVVRHPDVVIGERKLCGSAQRRSRGRVLHHGSLALGHDPAVREGASGEEALGGSPSMGEARAALVEAFEETLGVELGAGRLGAEEEALVARLAGRYRDPSWTDIGPVDRASSHRRPASSQKAARGRNSELPAGSS